MGKGLLQQEELMSLPPSDTLVPYRIEDAIIPPVEGDTTRALARVAVRLVVFIKRRGEEYFRAEFRLGEAYRKAVEIDGTAQPFLNATAEMGLPWVQRTWNTRAKFFDEFGGDEEAMARAYRERVRYAGTEDAVSFTRWVRGELFVPETDEEKVEDAVGKLEYAGGLTDRALDTIREVKGEDDPAYQHYREMVGEQREEAVAVLSQPKPETPRSAEYLRFIRSLPCAATGEIGYVEAHHVEQGGVGMKGSDFSCIPLSNTAHRYLEDKGHHMAEMHYGFSIPDAIAQCLHIFLTGQHLTLPKDLTRY